MAYNNILSYILYFIILFRYLFLHMYFSTIYIYKYLLYYVPTIYMYNASKSWLQVPHPHPRRCPPPISQVEVLLCIMMYNNI